MRDQEDNQHNDGCQDGPEAVFTVLFHHNQCYNPEKKGNKRFIVGEIATKRLPVPIGVESKFFNDGAKNHSAKEEGNNRNPGIYISIFSPEEHH